MAGRFGHVNIVDSVAFLSLYGVGPSLASGIARCRTAE